MRICAGLRPWLAVIALVAGIGCMGSVARADVTLYGSGTGPNNGNVLNNASAAVAFGATNLTVTLTDTSS